MNTTDFSKKLKDTAFQLAKEMTALARKLEDLEAENQQLKKRAEITATIVTYAIGALGMTEDDILESAAIQEDQVIDDSLPTLEDIRELAAQDAAELSDSQKASFYDSPFNNPMLHYLSY